jgi:ketosteroid isomerase-like protein
MISFRSLIVVSVLLTATLATLAIASDSRRDNQEDEVREAVVAFIMAIDRLDLDGVAASFSDDATAFYPFSFTPARLDGRNSIVGAQSTGFDWARGQLVAAGQQEPYSLGLNPTEMVVRMIGENAAVVTWHSNRSTHVGRRTSVMQRVDGEWLTVSHHASNMMREP